MGTKEIIGLIIIIYIFIDSSIYKKDKANTIRKNDAINAGKPFWCDMKGNLISTKTERQVVVRELEGKKALLDKETGKIEYWFKDGELFI